MKTYLKSVLARFWGVLWCWLRVFALKKGRAPSAASICVDCTRIFDPTHPHREAKKMSKEAFNKGSDGFRRRQLRLGRASGDASCSCELINDLKRICRLPCIMG